MPLSTILTGAMFIQAIAALAAFRDHDHGIGWLWLAVLGMEAVWRWA